MVVTDDVERGRMATRRIAFIGDEPASAFGFTSSAGRERAYSELLHDAGIPLRREYVRSGYNRESEG